MMKCLGGNSMKQERTPKIDTGLFEYDNRQETAEHIIIDFTFYF